MELKYKTFPEAYTEGLWQLKISGELENTRNGPVITIPEPVLLTILRPDCRVITCHTRNANPFFHVMETVWMFAGFKTVGWISQFNKRMQEFSDEDDLGSRVINGAYGHRWTVQWNNQIIEIIKRLREDPTTRQLVLTMWDPMIDLYQRHWKDRPCNTHIYFRVKHGTLNMTVCNRSNDYIWGMMGANAVHLTYLQEFIARAADLELGTYTVMTNNLHFYLNQYRNTDDLINTVSVDTVYPCQRYPILQKDEDWTGFFHQCRDFVRGNFQNVKNQWLLKVALPMYKVYLEYATPQLIEAEDWRIASTRWLQRNRATATV